MSCTEFSEVFEDLDEVEEEVAIDIHLAEESPKPSVFIAYPYRSRNEWIKHCVPSLLRLYGCGVMSGDNHHGEGISNAVADDIAQSKLLIAFFTKDQKLANGKWAPSQWVLQEIGFARGKGIPVVLIRETGVFTEAGILGDVQEIPLDAERETFAAFIHLRRAIGKLLFRGQSHSGFSICHLAKPGRKDTRKKQQWWDVWIWISGSEEDMDSIADVHYQFPKSFSPSSAEGDSRKAFGNYLETTSPINLRAKIRFKPGREPKQKIVAHRITFPQIGITPIP